MGRLCTSNCYFVSTAKSFFCNELRAHKVGLSIIDDERLDISMHSISFEKGYQVAFLKARLMASKAELLWLC